MSLTGSAVSLEAGHLISLPSRFWGEGRLFAINMCLQICSTVVPSQFVPRFPSHLLPLAFPRHQQGRVF